MGMYKTIGLFIALLTLLSTALGVYYGYFYVGESELVFEGLPSELHEYDNTVSSDFSFFLNNEGGATAFVDYVYVDYVSEISPKQSFAIEKGDSREVTISLYAPEEDVEDEFSIEVWYDDTMIRSEKINVRWGS
tara:strand:+ start:1391 stop:1792 length:402 start_codon:yes stop_codon:yes gene_type:complete